MKKILKITLVSFVLLILIVFIAEVYIWRVENHYLKSQNAFQTPDMRIGFHSGIKKKKYDFKTLGMKDGWGRPPEGLNIRKKKPIVVFGDYAAYGYNLNDNQTFSHKLSHLAKRPVYTKAFTGWGIQHMLLQLQQEDFYKLIPEPEYVIYVYSRENLEQLYLYSFSSWNILNEEFDIRYKESNKTESGLILVQDKNKIFNQIKRLYSVNILHHYLVKKFVKLSPVTSSDFALKHLIAARNEIQKHWKNTKFVVMLYDYDENAETDLYFIETLENNDFIVIDIPYLTQEELDSDKYQNHGHPTEAAWDLLTPLIVEKFGLK